MKSVEMSPGFIYVLKEKYQNESGNMTRLVGESSAVGDYEDSIERLGGRYLWVGGDHHLNREEVRELIVRMQYWLDKGRLELDDA